MATVEKRGNRWRLVAYLGYDEYTGKQIKRIKSIPIDGVPKAEAKRLATEFERDLLENKTMNIKNMTLSQFLPYWWEHYGNKLSVTTITRHITLLQRIETMLGAIRLSKLAPKHILQMIAQLEAPNARLDGKGALSSRTVAMHFSLLAAILNKAVKWKFIKTNPCDDVDPPKWTTKKQPILQKQELAKFLHLLLTEAPLRMQCFFLLAFTDGLRRSEICGIDESALDLENGTLEIKTVAVLSGTKLVYKDIPKTKSSASIMFLAPHTLKVIKQYLAEKKSLCEFMEVPYDTKLFRHPSGIGITPYYYTRWLKSFCEKHDLPKVTTQSFRKMGITYAMQKVNLKEASHFGRHSNIKTTADYYAEVLEDRRKEPTMYLNDLVEAARKSKGASLDD